ncbi:hypothetical protein GMSM_34080 [Geomonas sp. Red276]
MLVMAAFAIVLSLLAGFHPIQGQPKAEMNLAVADGQPGRIRVDVKPQAEIEGSHFVKQNFDYSCGSAALAILLRFQLGEKLSEKQVIQGLLRYGDSEQIAKRRAFSLLDMKRFVTVLGYQGVGYRADLEDLKTLEAPCLVPIKIFEYRHFAVLRGVAKGHVFLTDPWRGDISFTLSEFKDIWYDNVLFVVSLEGSKGLSALRLKEADLRFIDEDEARRLVLDRELPNNDRDRRFIIDNPKVFQYYGK